MIQSTEELNKFIKLTIPQSAQHVIYALLLEKGQNEEKFKKAIIVLSPSAPNTIREPIETALNNFDSTFNEISFLHEQNIVNQSAVLKYLKSHQPLKKENILKYFNAQPNSQLTDHQLGNMLDVLRKHKYIHRSKDGDYMLTETGLRAVPHGNYRSSSDIERALVLGKKEW